VIETNRTAYQRAVLKGGMEAASMRGAWLGIDLVALQENLKAIKRGLKPGTRIMAVVKADGYGHGAQAIAQAALQSGASYLGVATVEEGMKLRRSGLDEPILVLGLVPDSAISHAIEHGLQLTVSSGRQIQVVERISAGLGKTVEVNLKVNTGMTRVGCEPHEAPALMQYLLASQILHVIGISSHFATAEGKLPKDAEAQLAKFDKVVRRIGLPPGQILRHIANSAGAIYMPASHYDMVRVGLAMYGHSPRGPEPSPIELSPILSLRARIAQVKEVHAGASVGYGSTWTAKQSTRLALLPVGYADGLPRSLSNRGHVLVRGTPCPIVGRVSMDQTVVDVGRTPVEPGEEVLLLGGHGDQSVSVERWAELDGTINYEILCGLGQRLPKMYYR
jgi:alanine racemase